MLTDSWQLGLRAIFCLRGVCILSGRCACSCAGVFTGFPSYHANIDYLQNSLIRGTRCCFTQEEKDAKKY